MDTVLITGAAGGIGSRMRQLLKGIYPRLILSDRVTPANLTSDEEFIAADLTDRSAMENLLKGVDGVLHLGGQAMEAEWDVIHGANIVGCYNLFEAAQINGIRRFPVTFYKNEWETIFGLKGEIEQFIVDNNGELATK